MFKCSKCEYETRDKSNANKHIKNKLTCFGAVISKNFDLEEENKEESQPELQDNQDLLSLIKSLDNKMSIMMKKIENQDKMIQAQTDQIVKLTELVLKKSKEETNVEKATDVQTKVPVITSKVLTTVQTIKKIDTDTSFGKEIVMSALRKKGNPVVNLTKEIHFNPKYPEFMNIVVRNKKLPDCFIFDDVWKTEKKQNMVNLMLADYQYIVEQFIGYSDDENIDDGFDVIDPFIKSCFENYKLIRNNAGEKYDEELNEQMLDLLYDNRDIIPK